MMQINLLFGAAILTIFGLLYYQVVKPVQQEVSTVTEEKVEAVSPNRKKTNNDKKEVLLLPPTPASLQPPPVKVKATHIPYVEMVPDVLSQHIDLSGFSASAASFSNSYFKLINSNRVFSPVALVHTLSILHLASTKEAQEEIAAAVGGVYNLQQLQLLGRLLSRNLSYPTLMTTYFSINSQIPVDAIFTEQMKAICTVSRDNFNDSLRTMTAINQYFSDRTEGLLTTAAKAIKPDSRALLFNTLYFKNEWEYPFDPRKSTALNFTQVNGARRVYRAMVGVIKTPYYADATMQMIELNFKHGPYAMGFILPKPKPKENISPPVTFNSSQIYSYLPHLTTEHYVKVLLPKFRLKRMLRMQGWLKQLGISTIFDAKRAQFPMITSPKSRFYITDIVHEGILGIDELGSNSLKQWWKFYQVQNSNGKRNQTKTATPKPTKQFLANRNFLFYLRHKPSNLLLFVGDYDG